MTKQRILAALLTVTVLGLGGPGLTAQDEGRGRSERKNERNERDEDGRGGEASRIRIGFEIAPLSLNLARKNRALVGLGSYIVNAVGECNGCHTVDGDPFLPGGNPFDGEPEMIDPDRYLVGGTAFGPFVSRNLRPDGATGRPAGLTLEQFRHVLRTGEDLRDIPPAPLLQVMPWPAYRHMTDRDIRAIYEYLSALPPAP